MIVQLFRLTPLIVNMQVGPCTTSADMDVSLRYRYLLPDELDIRIWFLLLCVPMPLGPLKFGVGNVTL